MSGGHDPSVFAPFPVTDATNFIQWKGTDVCIDIRCSEDGFHYDGTFMHLIRCPDCGAVYEVGTQVHLRKVTEPDILADPYIKDGMPDEPEWREGP